jgi:hypothetical protein
MYGLRSHLRCGVRKPGTPHGAAPALDIQRNRFEQPFDAVSAPGRSRGHRLLQTSRLDDSSNLALEAVAGDDEVVLVDADTYGGTVAHATIQELHRNPCSPGPVGSGTTTLLNFC